MDQLLAMGIMVAATAAGPDQAPQPSPDASTAVSTAASPAAAAAATGHPSYSGRWLFNKDKSDDPREKMREARAGQGSGGYGGGGGEHHGGHRGGGYGGGGGGGGWGGGGYGGGHRGGGYGGGGDQGGDRSGSASRTSFFEVPTDMTITQTETEIAILDKEGALRTLHPDGKQYKDDSGNQVKSQWLNGHLVVETTRQQGPKFTETYDVGGTERQLVVTLSFQGQSSGPVTIRRVYDPPQAE